jgi:hypothetical protein
MGKLFKLKNGSILLSTEAPGGIYNASQLKKIASLCDGESVVVKATEDQRLALLVNPDKAATIAADLKAIGLGIRHYQDGLHQPVSCVGEMCEDHEQDALGSALDVSAEIENLKLTTPLKIGINGCAKCCVPCHTLDISIVGDSSGYRISLGGKNSQLPEMASFMAEGVPAAELARLVKSIIEIYKSGAQENETLQEYIDRDGSAKFVQALAPWSQDAADSGDPFAVTVASDTGAELKDESQFDSNSNEAPSVDSAPIDAESIEILDAETSDEMAIISDDDVIVHEQLSGTEGAELVMEDTPLTADELNREHEFEIAATSDSISMDSLEEIPVSADSSDMSDVQVMVKDEIGEDSPEISMQELELDDDLSQAAADLQEAIETPAAVEAAPESVVSNEPAVDEEVATPAEIIQVSSEPLEMESSVEPLEQPEVEFQEDAIDASDVMRASSETAKVQESAENEDQLEAELSASIEAQKDLLAGDVIDSPEDQNVGMLEMSAPAFDDPASQSSEVSEISDAEVIDSGESEESDHEEEFDVHDHLPLSEVVSTAKISAFKPASQQAAAKKSWAISGFDMDDQGHPVITWTNGASITITPEAVTLGTLSVCGHTMSLSKTANGVKVEIDGVKMFIPTAA